MPSEPGTNQKRGLYLALSSWVQATHGAIPKRGGYEGGGEVVATSRFLRACLELFLAIGIHRPPPLGIAYQTQVVETSRAPRS